MTTLLKWILSPFKKKKSAPKETIQQANTSNDTVLQTNTVDMLAKATETRDVGWFSRKNHLVNEFAFTPTPVYRRPQDKEPVGWLNADGKLIKNKEYAGNDKVEIYRGYAIKYFNASELAIYKKYVDDKLLWNEPVVGFLSEEQYATLMIDNERGEMLLADDVDKLDDAWKPNLDVKPDTTYVIGTDPHRDEVLKEVSKQMKESDQKLLAKLGIPIDDPEQAEMREEEVNTKNVMTRAAEKYIDNNGVEKIQDEGFMKELKAYQEEYHTAATKLEDVVKSSIEYKQLQDSEKRKYDIEPLKTELAKQIEEYEDAKKRIQEHVGISDEREPKINNIP